MNRQESDGDDIRIPSNHSIKKMLDPINQRLDTISYALQNSTMLTMQKTRSKEDNEYYRNEDLKRIFRLSNNTIIKYRENGTLPFSKIGDIYIYPKKEIDIIIENNRVS